MKTKTHYNQSETRSVLKKSDIESYADEVWKKLELLPGESKDPGDSNSRIMFILGFAEMILDETDPDGRIEKTVQWR